ncbi:hypothetical protein C9925_00860 [cyanobacterium G8-9]|nr:hypothetical protein C9925_00860 [cyanobacterium G8-9]
MKLKIIVLILLAISSVYAKKNCSQFKSWDDANKYFKSKKSGYSSLDKNHNGTPCEHILKKEKSQDKKKTRIRIYQYGSPAGFGQSFSSLSACEKARAKLSKANAGTDYSYKCENK